MASVLAAGGMASYPTRDVDRLYCPAITYQCAIGPPRPRRDDAAAVPSSPPPPPCVACAYKICNFDVARDADFSVRVPNARPETCPRSFSSSSSSSSRDGGDGRGHHGDDASPAGYHRGMRVLAIGDGDFSFSSAIVRVVVSSWVDDDDDIHDNDNDNEDNRDAKNVTTSSSYSAGGGKGRGCVVATSYEDADTLRDVYPDFDIALRHLMKSGGDVVVGYNVDATRLAETLPAEETSKPNASTIR